MTQFSGWEVFLKGGWVTATFVTNYMPFFLFPVLYIIWKFKTGVPIVKPADMDFISDLDEIEADSYVFQLLKCWWYSLCARYEEPPPKNKLEAFWAWLVS